MTAIRNALHSKQNDQTEITKTVELIQQWQYVGKVHPLLMKDQAFENLKACGLTSAQSYVTWAEIEHKKGVIDFSSYDPLVEKLLRHNIKWVPFLILGPAYATPQWFQNSTDSVGAKCLEHGKTCKIQSIWNPNLPQFVDHFLNLFSRHYNDPNLFESITLGISGNWGESIFPAFGGFIGDSHVHPGWWCGDRFARQDFQQFALNKYKRLGDLNQAWGTHFNSVAQIDFPLSGSKLKNAYFRAIQIVPTDLKPLLKRIKHQWGEPVATRIDRLQRTFKNRPRVLTTQEWLRKLEFIEWYQGAMTNWAAFWLKTARHCFPQNEIYLVTGGEGEPMLGADLAAQAKEAAACQAGIRVTNQTDTYADSFVRARLVASACRHYQTYFTTEEAGINRPEGVSMRLFDAVSSGAKGAYFKSIIGTGQDACSKMRMTPGELTEGAQNLKSNLHILKYSGPIIKTAVFFPKTTIAINPLILDRLYAQCSKLRALIDFDLVDDLMISDGALAPYDFFVLIKAQWVKKSSILRIREWVNRGGILIAPDGVTMTTVDGEGNSFLAQFCYKTGMKSNGDGYTILHKGSPQDYLRFIANVVTNHEERYPWPSMPIRPGEDSQTFSTCLDDHIISYSHKSHKINLQSR